MNTGRGANPMLAAAPAVPVPVAATWAEAGAGAVDGLLRRRPLGRAVATGNKPIIAMLLVRCFLPCVALPCLALFCVLL
jgi:hypothetical protein